MIYQALLLSAIGTNQDHFPVLLAAADSTLEGMLSLNVNVIEEGAGKARDASSSQSCALVMVCGAGLVHHDDMRSSVKSQASVRAYRQAKAREVCSRRIAPELWRGGPWPYRAEIDDSETLFWCIL